MIRGVCACPSPQCNERLAFPSMLRSPDESEAYDFQTCSNRVINRGMQLRTEHADAIKKAALDGDGLEVCYELLDGCDAQDARVHLGEIDKMFKVVKGAGAIEKEEL